MTVDLPGSVLNQQTGIRALASLSPSAGSMSDIWMVAHQPSAGAERHLEIDDTRDLQAQATLTLAAFELLSP